MAEIKVKGYANNPKVRESSKGKFTTFTLAERQKQRDGTYTKAYYNVTDFKEAGVKDGDFITVDGYLKVREYEKDGAKRQSMDVVANAISISPALPGKEATPEKDPWDLGDSANG